MTSSWTHYSGATPEPLRNVFSINQGANDDGSQIDPHPEVGLLTSGREDRHDMATGVQRESTQAHDNLEPENPGEKAGITTIVRRTTWDSEQIQMQSRDCPTNDKELDMKEKNQSKGDSFLQAVGFFCKIYA